MVIGDNAIGEERVGLGSPADLGSLTKVINIELWR
jgi:hypothetical protein